MSEQLTEKVAFDFIRYANCWEDADILLEGLQLHSGSKVLSIGSAGDNSFSLLSQGAALVVAVDVSKAQLHLIALKKELFKHLEREEILAFLGFHPSEKRKETFDLIKGNLPSETRVYWEAHRDQLENGLIDQGKFERYFQLFCRKILPWIHSKKNIRRLFEEKSRAEQQLFYDQVWNNWRWRLLFKLFFSKYIMGKYGRDPEFLKEVEVNVGQFIFSKAARQLSSVQAQQNFMLRYNLTGSFSTLVPHYLEVESVKKIKQNIDALEIFEGYAQQTTEKFGSFDAMNLSNIFEYMNPTLFRETGDQLLRLLNSEGKMAYWNLMVPRQLSLIFPESLQFEAETSATLSAIDKGFFYKQFILESKR